MVIEAKKVLYCDACGMPPEYCSFGPDFETHCVPWLKKNVPDVFDELYGSNDAADDDGNNKKNNDNKPSEPWTAKERLTAFYTKYMPEKIEGIPAILEKYEGKEDKLFIALTKKYGPEPKDPYYSSDDSDDDSDDDSVGVEGKKMAALSISASDKKKRRGAGAKTVNKVNTRVIIQKISRNKRKAVTIVIGMDTVPGMKLKDVARDFSKRFAGSSSVKNTPKGGKEIIIQGDHTDEVADMVVQKFKVDEECVFLEVDGSLCRTVKG